MGLPLKAPLTSYDVIYTLPMLTIKESKGVNGCMHTQAYVNAYTHVHTSIHAYTPHTPIVHDD